MPDAEEVQQIEEVQFYELKVPCWASIWLLGGVSNCNKNAGHDGPHEILIQWSVQ